MKRVALALAIMCALCAPAFSQSTIVAGTHVLDNTGNLLASGKWCFNGTCLTVTNGVFSGSVTSATATITVANGGATTYLTIPSATVSGSYFSFDTYVVPSSASITGLGGPRIACSPGAIYTQTDGALNAWQCVNINGTASWNSISPGGPAQPISQGGTGASDAASALANLGGCALSGCIMTGALSAPYLTSSVNGLINVSAPPFNAAANGCGVGGTDQTSIFSLATGAAQAAHSGIYIQPAALPYQVNNFSITGTPISVEGQTYSLSTPFPSFGNVYTVTGSALCSNQTSGKIFSYAPTISGTKANGLFLKNFYVMGPGEQGAAASITSITESGSTATATVSGSVTVPADTQLYITGNTMAITSVAVVNGGSYSVCPTGVTFSGGTGSGASATPVCTASAVTSISLSSGGQYSLPPTAAVTGGTGSGAVLQPVLPTYNGTVTVQTSTAGSFTFLARGRQTGLGTGTGGTATQEATCLSIGDATTANPSYPTHLTIDNVGAGNCGVGTAMLAQDSHTFKWQLGGNYADGFFGDGNTAYTLNTVSFDGGISFGDHIQFDMAMGGSNITVTNWDFETPPLNDASADMVWFAALNSSLGPGNYYEANGTNFFTGDAIYIPVSPYNYNVKVDGGTFITGTGANASIEVAGGGVTTIELKSGRIQGGSAGIVFDSTAQTGAEVTGLLSCSELTNNSAQSMVATDIYGDVCPGSTAINNSQPTNFNALAHPLQVAGRDVLPFYGAVPFYYAGGSFPNCVAYGNPLNPPSWAPPLVTFNPDGSNNAGYIQCFTQTNGNWLNVQVPSTGNTTQTIDLSTWTGIDGLPTSGAYSYCGATIGCGASNHVQNGVFAVAGANPLPPIIATVSGAPDMACAHAGDTTINAHAITGGSSTTTTITINTASTSGLVAGVSWIGVAGVTPSGYNTAYVLVQSFVANTSITFASTNNPAAWSSGGSWYLACGNGPGLTDTSDALSATPYTFNTQPSLPIGVFNSYPVSHLDMQLLGFSSTTAASTNWAAYYGSTILVEDNTGGLNVVNSLPGYAALFSVEFLQLSYGSPNSTISAAIQTVPFTTNAILNTAAVPKSVSTSSTQPGKIQMWYSATGLGSVNVTGIGGCTVTGTSGQTVLLTSFNNGGTGATATVTLNASVSAAALSSSNVGSIAVTNTYYGMSSSPTSATCSAGTASSASGTASFTSALGGAQGNAILPNAVAMRPN